MCYLLGYDIGSSSIKASLMDAQNGQLLAGASSPDKELEILAPKPGWAEQHPDTWWHHVKEATARLKSHLNFAISKVKAIGISYQMHGLVLVDKNKKVLRPSIIWCDSRAVETGNLAAEKIGREKCLSTMLNLPGNFTASKLKWVKDNEPDVYRQIYKIMLPGEYIAMKMTDRIVTTPSGLSEGIMWDFQKNTPARLILEHYGIPQEFLAEIEPSFSIQGELTSQAAAELGLSPGTLVSYRAGDQPNNAWSLNVCKPGQVAATAGTSAVVYAVSNKTNYDPKSRVNIFVHVNHTVNDPSYGVLLCLNGAGILNSWLRHNFTSDTRPLDYGIMNDMAASVNAGSEGLFIFPYGNGAERTLDNKFPGASIVGLNLNIHNKAHILRAAQEGIVFALNYGLEIMSECGIKIQTVKAGKANMFLSPLFGKVFSALTETVVNLYNTDGSQGAARGAGLGTGIYKSSEQAFVGLEPLKTIEPDSKLTSIYKEVYNNWKKLLKNQLKDN